MTNSMPPFQILEELENETKRKEEKEEKSEKQHVTLGLTEEQYKKLSNWCTGSILD